MSQQGIHQDVFLDTVKHLYLSLKGVTSYPLDHPASIKPIQKTYQIISHLLETQNMITTSIVDDTILVEDIPIKNTFDFSSKFIQDLTRRNVASITFSKGLSESDLQNFLMIISEPPDRLKREGGVSSILQKKGISNIKVNEIRYEQVTEDTSRHENHENMEIFDYVTDNSATMDYQQEDLLNLLESSPERISDMIRIAAEADDGEFPDNVKEQTKTIHKAIKRVAKCIVNRAQDSEEFKDTFSDILSTFDKDILIRISPDINDVEMDKDEIIDCLSEDIYYDTIAEIYLEAYIKEGKHDLNMLEKFLPEEDAKKKARHYFKREFDENGKGEDFSKIDHDFFKDHWIELSDEIKIKEITGSEIKDADLYNRETDETQERITELLSAGRSGEAKALIGQFSQRLDDKSYEIRKNVAESFNGIISALNEFDSLKDNFQQLCGLFVNKLKKEDHADAYLSLSDNLLKVCESQDSNQSYFVDETLGHRLYTDQRVTKPQLQEVLSTRKGSGRSMQYTFAALNYTNEHVLTHYLADQYRGFSMINISDVSHIPDNIISTIPVKYAKRYISIPFKLDDHRLFTAMQNPKDIESINDLEFISGYSVIPFAGAEYYLINAIERYYHTTIYGAEFDQAIQEIRQEEAEVEYVEEKEEKPSFVDEIEGVQGPVVKLVNVILKEAMSKRASDIHIEPYEDELRVRFRVDGTLVQMMNPPNKYKNGITSRLKIMSHLNISEKRLPQDGRFKIKTDGKCVDFRLSTFPGAFGETVVLRLLDKSNLEIDISKLGMRKTDRMSLMAAMYKSKGMILVTGPTGSGKTTTLYSVLQKLNDGTRNISTAEDPIEYNIPGINQFQMNTKIGLDFATALRSFLRQDPDIIMVGEMRDLETAEIAVKASLTGHLVLSTLHTNSAIETITRLLEMGIEPFLVVSSVDLIIAQRLMRKICPDCISETRYPDKQLDYLKKWE
ncbi:MAG: GspE/PulE family protein [bacterium]